MQYTTLGNSGLRVSRLALGTMTFGEDWGWGAGREPAQAMFNQFVEAGGNLFDTADLYVGGTSEEWLGAFITESGLRDQAVIATKFSFNSRPGDPNAGGNGRKTMISALEGSLKRLGTDYVDLFILHCWDRMTPIDEVMRGFDHLVQSGKVRYVGLSNVPAWVASRAQTLAELRAYEPLVTLQMEYSLAERGVEAEFVPLAKAHGLDLMVWSPLASGLLSGKYRPSETGTEGRLATLKDSGNPAFEKFTDRNWAIVKELEKVAMETGRDMAQVAINWVANRSGVASVLLGGTRPEHIAGGLKALDFCLSEDHLARLDAISRPAPGYPYKFFGPEIQGMLTGGTEIVLH